MTVKPSFVFSKSFQYLEAMDYNDVDTETDTLACR